MSRTILCVLTAAVLATLSVAVMIVRYRVLGDEIVPIGPGTWKVTMVISGHSQGDTRLMSVTPLDFGSQHVLREECRSAELLDRPPEARHPERRLVLWSRRAGAPEGDFRARCQFYCVTDVHQPTSSMTRLARSLYAPPKRGEYLDAKSHAGTDEENVSATARRLTAGLERPLDQAEALYHFVAEEIVQEPSVGSKAISAAECLKNGSGDSAGKSRLLVALLRNRSIPARLVAGLTLSRGPEQQAHHWVESWIHDHWLAMCPCYHHFDGVPSSYLVLGFGDMPVVRGHNVRDLDCAFLVEHVAPLEVAPNGEQSTLRRVLLALSLYRLAPPDQKLVEWLLLLPLAALIVCVFRNLIGLYSFGTFAPALVGLSFRELHSLPGMLVFVSILLIGWVLRRLLDHYHLLQVPRVAFMITLVVIVVITAVVAANFGDLSATNYVALFPMVILTGMIERFWTLETEDSTSASFRTLLSTMVIAACIALCLSIPFVVSHLFRYPETLGLIMAVQLLIGRYTGYRLSELFRFRDFLQQAAEGRQRWAVTGGQ